MPCAAGGSGDLGLMSVAGIPRDHGGLGRTDVGRIRQGDQRLRGRSEQRQAALMRDREVDHEPVAGLGRGIESHMLALTLSGVEIELPVRSGAGSGGNLRADEHHLQLARGARKVAMAAGRRDRALELVVEWLVDHRVHVDVRMTRTEVAEREGTEPVHAGQTIAEDEP